MFLMLSSVTLRSPAHKRNSLIGNFGTACLVSGMKKMAGVGGGGESIGISKHVRSVFFALSEAEKQHNYFL